MNRGKIMAAVVLAGIGLSGCYYPYAPPPPPAPAPAYGYDPGYGYAPGYAYAPGYYGPGYYGPSVGVVVGGGGGRFRHWR